MLKIFSGLLFFYMKLFEMNLNILPKSCYCID